MTIPNDVMVELPVLPATSAGSSESVEGAVTEIIELDCDSGALVGQYVRVDEIQANFAVVATDNLEKMPVIGRIKEKITATHAKIVLRGVIDLSPSLSPGRLFLSSTGTPTLSVPTSGYRQELGYSFGNGKAHLEPSLIVTKL